MAAALTPRRCGTGVCFDWLGSSIGWEGTLCLHTKNGRSLESGVFGGVHLLGVFAVSTLAFGEWRKLQETGSAFTLPKCFRAWGGGERGGVCGCAGGKLGTIAREDTAVVVMVLSFLFFSLARPGGLLFPFFFFVAHM